MNTSTPQARNFRPKVGIVIAVALAAAIAGVGATPAFGDDHNDRGRDSRDRGHKNARVRHDYRPVYSPPSAYYPARPSPGISLFIPLNFR